MTTFEYVYHKNVGNMSALWCDSRTHVEQQRKQKRGSTEKQDRNVVGRVRAE